MHSALSEHQPFHSHLFYQRQTMQCPCQSRTCYFVLSPGNRLVQPGAIRQVGVVLLCIANSCSFIKKLLYIIHPGYLLHCEPKRVCPREKNITTCICIVASSHSVLVTKPLYSVFHTCSCGFESDIFIDGVGVLWMFASHY